MLVFQLVVKSKRLINNYLIHSNFNNYIELGRPLNLNILKRLFYLKVISNYEKL